MRDRLTMEGLIRNLLPPGYGCAVLPLSLSPPPLLPEEQEGLARAVPKRRHEFALGRLALRRAIAEAGHHLPPDWPITSLPDRRAHLPPGVRASLAHGGAFCIAIASPPGGPWVGVDVEAMDRPVHPGLAGAVAPCRMTPEDPLLAFCVKEAMFKAQYPATRRMLDFCDVPAVIRGDRARACLGQRLIAARWGQAEGHYLAVSLWWG